MTERRARVLIALAAAVVTTGCNDDDFEPFGRLSSLRILAIAGDPVAPASGESTALTPLVYVPPGQSAPTYRWTWCPFPGSAGDAYPCLIDEPTLINLAGGSVPPYDLGTAPTATFDNSVDPQVLQSVCEGTPEVPVVPNCEGGFPIQIGLTVTTDRDEVRAVRTLRLRFDGEPYLNTNPVVAGIFVGEQPVDSAATVLLTRDEETTIRADIGLDQAEEYIGPDDEGLIGNQRERLVATWFVESGDTDHEHTSFIDGSVPLEQLLENTWTPEKREDYARDTALVFVVLRDNREGVGWVSGSVRLSDGP